MATALASTRQRQAALASLCAVLFLTFLDTTIVSVTLAEVQSDLGAGVRDLQWVVNGYTLVFASFMLAGGVLGDRWGRRRVMLGGLGLFCVGSVVSALASTVGVLIAGRVIMGVGAAASEPGTLSIVRQLYPEPGPRARALGGWAAVSGLALALGPVVGGVLTGLGGWPAVFWFNLAAGLVILAGAAVTVPESADPTGRRLDVAGLVLAPLALGAGILGVTEGETAGYTSPVVLGLFALALLASVTFVSVERRADDPALDLAFFRRPTYVAAIGVAFAAFFAVFALFFFVALYLQVVRGLSAYALAGAFGPMAVAMVAASAATGVWVARRGARIPMTLGCLAAAAGVFLVDAVLSRTVSVPVVAAGLALAGAGFGIALVPVTSAALGSVPAQRSGMAASTTNTSRALGAVWGVAVLGALVNAQLTGSLRSRLQEIGVPAQFQSLVIEGVTHGGLPAGSGAVTNPAAQGGQAALVQQVLDAAFGAFDTGLHLALLVAGGLLTAAALLAAWGVRRDEQLAAAEG